MTDKHVSNLVTFKHCPLHIPFTTVVCSIQKVEEHNIKEEPLNAKWGSSFEVVVISPLQNTNVKHGKMKCKI